MKTLPMTVQRVCKLAACAVAAAALVASPLHATLIHRYTFNTDATDSVGTEHGTLVDGPLAGAPSVTGGQLVLGNANFVGPSSNANYLSLPATILPASGSVTIEQWFTFGGSGFFTEGWAFTNGANDTNPPSQTNGQYLIHTISNPQGGPNPAAGGSSVAQALTGWGSGESRAFGTTAGLGFAGGGYLDDGGTYFSATVIDAGAGTLSYYVYRVSDGLGGLQSSIPAIPLSSYSFTNAYLGRSPFPGDNATNGSIDEFRIYSSARSGAAILADFQAGANSLVPEPTSLGLVTLAAAAAVAMRRRRLG